MSAGREKDSADFDLDRFVDMFDTALASSDPRVVNALRQLMMMVALTAPEAQGVRLERGPLRRLCDDVNNLNKRTERLEHEVRLVQRAEKQKAYEYPYEKYTISALEQQHNADDQARIDHQIDKFYNGSPKGLK